MYVWKLAIMSLITMLAGKPGNLYAQTLVVLETTDDYVLCMDFNGYEWAFDNTLEEDEWYRGDLVSCIMYDNGTDIIYDDEILTTKYDGWVDSFGYDTETRTPLMITDID